MSSSEVLHILELVFDLLCESYQAASYSYAVGYFIPDYKCDFYNFLVSGLCTRIEILDQMLNKDYDLEFKIQVHQKYEIYGKKFQ